MTVYQRSNGVYYANFYDSTRNPQQRRISLKTKNEDIANEKAEQLERKWIMGEWDPWAPDLPDDRRTLMDAVFDALESRWKNVAESTRENREYHFTRFAREVGEDKLVHHVSQRDVRDYLAPYEGQTLRTFYSQLNALFREFERREWIRDNPMDKIRAPRVGYHGKVITVKEEEYRKLLQRMKNDWMKALLRILWHTGLRQGEARNLPWKFVNLEDNLIEVRNTDRFQTKNRKDRIVPIPQVLSDFLAEWRTRQLDHCWETRDYSHRFVLSDFYGKVPTSMAAIMSFKRYRRKCGLREEITLHSFRHAYATRMARKGMKIHILQDILGHSNIKHTLIYQHNFTDDLQNAVNNVYEAM